MGKAFNYDVSAKREHFDEEFSIGGQWEANNGRDQTRRFAEHFTRNISIPLEEFSLLDAGCALGDALPVLHKAYPNARLFGCDVSQVATERCKNDYGQIADFFAAAFEDISGFWDVIYCSHVLEHFEEYKSIASWLLKKCNILYIMTPYFELRNGQPLDPKVDKGHMVTFYKDSFDDFFEKGDVSLPVKKWIKSSRRGWGPSSVRTRVLSEIKRALKIVLLRRYFPPHRQIIYELISKNYRPNE